MISTKNHVLQCGTIFQGFLENMQYNFLQCGTIFQGFLEKCNMFFYIMIPNETEKQFYIVQFDDSL